MKGKEERLELQHKDTPSPTKCERHSVMSLCGAIRGCGFCTQGEQIS